MTAAATTAATALMTAYIAPYCENYTLRALYKNYAKDMLNDNVFNCRLNEPSVGISLMFSGRLFQAVGSAALNAWSPNLVKDDSLSASSLISDFDEG